MATYSDSRNRVVSLNVLRAICERLSSMCHRYEIHHVTAHRVSVSYSNPDEYGNSRPMLAHYPCYSTGDKENPQVVLDITRIVFDDSDGEGWQNFECIKCCPALYKNGDNWATGLELLADGAAVSRYTFLAYALEKFLGESGPIPVDGKHISLRGHDLQYWHRGAILAEKPYADGEQPEASSARAMADELYESLEGLATAMGVSLWDYRDSIKVSLSAKATV